MIVGCYDLRVICDGEGCSAGEYRAAAEREFVGAETGGAARAAARRAGWKLDLAEGTCLCPACQRPKQR